MPTVLGRAVLGQRGRCPSSPRPGERARCQTVPSVRTFSGTRARAGYIVFCYNCVLNSVLNYKGKKLAETRAASRENQNGNFIFFQKCLLQNRCLPHIHCTLYKCIIKIFSHYGFHCKQTTQTQLHT